MKCNIDQTGRRVRTIWGVGLLLIAITLAVLGYFAVLSGWWVWVLAIALAAGGVFALFEARKGWCAVRAMGFRTPV